MTEENHENLNLIVCPNPHCGIAKTRPEPELGTDPVNEKVVCEKCKTEYCRCCSDYYHEGSLCKDNSQKKNESREEAFKVWNQMNKAQKCPHCGVETHKTAETNEIKCGSCGSSFCWICLEQFTSSHWQEGRCQNLDLEKHWLEAQKIREWNQHKRAELEKETFGYKAKRAAELTGKGLLLGLAAIVALPVAAVAAVPVMVGVGGMWVMKELEIKNEQEQKQEQERKLVESLRGPNREELEMMYGTPDPNVVVKPWPSEQQGEDTTVTNQSEQGTSVAVPPPNEVGEPQSGEPTTPTPTAEAGVESNQST